MNPSLVRLPAPGDMVGGYRIISPLGDGGQGRVYRAEAAGQPFALKFLERGCERWGEREAEALLRFRHPGVVGFRGCGRWKDLVHGPFYVAMELVEGLTLYDYVMVHNPSARKAAELMLSLGRALLAVHEAGVLHRDVKRENIMVRLPGEEPVLLDFGLSALEGTPSAGGTGQVTGTLEYVSPEAWRHASEEEERYRPTARDEQWALGVTDLLPFGGREDPLMTRRVLREQPKAPHTINPRVPPELGALCLRLLEKNPEHRYADMKEFCGAVRQVLEGAVGVEAWDVPLGQPDAPECRTTDLDMTLLAGQEVELFLARIKPPQRGRVVPWPVALPPVAPPPVDAPLPGLEPAQAFVPPAEEVLAELEEWAGPAAGPPEVPEVPVRVEAGKRRGRAVGVWAGAACGLLAGVVGAGAFFVASPRTVEPLPEASAPRSPAVEEPRREWGVPQPTQENGWKVAPPLKPPEAERVAPLSAERGSAAPVASDATAQGEEASVQTPKKKQPSLLGAVKKAAAVVGACSTLGCAGPGPEVRASPPPGPPPREPCPQGSQEAMKELRFKGRAILACLAGTTGGVAWVPFKEGWTTVDTGKWQFSGRFFAHGKRVLGYFTQATSLEGKTYPVCLQWASTIDEKGRMLNCRDLEALPEFGL
jgi:eukaryotic-like serine/threonine-protein kinase